MAPGRSVQTFPSGLVRVERRYFCRKADAFRYRSDLAVGNLLPNDDGAPAIDGLYIYPEPQEQSRDDGFVEFRVTAYGRSNAFSLDRITRQSLLSSYFLLRDYSDDSGFLTSFLTQRISSFNEAFTISVVLPTSEPPTSLFVPPEISNPLVMPVDTNTPLKTGVVTIQTSTQITTRETRIYLLMGPYESKTFGRWSEYTVTWNTLASVTEKVRFL
jgi:hypothetical protein